MGNGHSLSRPGRIWSGMGLRWAYTFGAAYPVGLGLAVASSLAFPFPFCGVGVVGVGGSTLRFLVGEEVGEYVNWARWDLRSLLGVMACL